MTKPVRPALQQPARDVEVLKRQQYAQTRVVGTGRKRTVATKIGIPSDADYTAATMPAIGSIVTDISGHRIYVRVAVGSWLSAALT